MLVGCLTSGLEALHHFGLDGRGRFLVGLASASTLLFPACPLACCCAGCHHPLQRTTVLQQVMSVVVVWKEVLLLLLCIIQFRSVVVSGPSNHFACARDPSLNHSCGVG
jgi:hypothetical protein